MQVKPEIDYNIRSEWAIEYEEVCVFHTTFLAAFLVPSRVLIRSVMQGVHQRLWAAVMGCSIDIRPQLLKNVLLAGGNTLFDGLPEMLFKKLKALSTGRHQPGYNRRAQLSDLDCPGRFRDLSG